MSFLANVKSVLSGDTLVLVSPNNPSAERTLSLAYVAAPRLSKDGDEPFAFQSREFLRSLTVGKQVKFSVSCECQFQLHGLDPVTSMCTTRNNMLT
jgi:staphylococcal nuclease domain-containing protein 1